MAYLSLDIIRRSATSSLTPALQARDHQRQVAKLLDVTACIGCKACQVACSEWNDIRAKVGYNLGVYDNTTDLDAKAWTVMRFSEVEENGRLAWLIHKDGCMHCADPDCLKACPSAGAIMQYANGIVDFQSEHCIGCGYCIAGCPFNVPRINPQDNRAHKCTLCVASASARSRPASKPVQPAPSTSSAKRRCSSGQRSASPSSRRAGLTTPASTILPASAAPT
nr:Formate dehydrogenase-O subunit beta [Candidatus Pantoea persica]